MSDFINSFWSFYIILIVVVGLVGLIVLVRSQETTVVPLDEKGQPQKTTGHIFDGTIEEYNNPMPRWWVSTLYLAIIFGAVYLFLYPGLGSYTGYLHWSEQKQYTDEVSAEAEKVKPLYAGYLAQPIEALSQNHQAMQTAKRLFLSNCSQCHGADAGGNVGFPRLTDKIWLYGGSPEQIVTTITNGRNGIMPPMIDAIGGLLQQRMWLNMYCR